MDTNNAETEEKTKASGQMHVEGEQTDIEEEQTDMEEEQVFMEDEHIYDDEGQMYMGEGQYYTGEGAMFMGEAWGGEEIEEKVYIKKIKESLDLNKVHKRMKILKRLLENFRKDIAKIDQPYPSEIERDVCMEALEEHVAEEEGEQEETKVCREKDKEMEKIIEDMLEDEWLDKRIVLTSKQIKKLIKILQEIITQIEREMGLLAESSETTLTSLGLCRGRFERKKKKEFEEEEEEVFEGMAEEGEELLEEEEVDVLSETKEKAEGIEKKSKLLKDYIIQFFDDLMQKEIKDQHRYSETDLVGFDVEKDLEDYEKDILGECVPLDNIIRDEMLRRIDVVKKKHGIDMYLVEKAESTEPEEYYVETEEEPIERKEEEEEDEKGLKEREESAEIEGEEDICERIVLAFEIEIVPPLKPFPYLSKNSTLKRKSIGIVHCFGCNPKKPYNLGQLDEQHLVFQSGNFVHFLNTETKKIRTIPSMGGNAVGSFTTNVANQIIAVCERGDNPFIVVHQWPDYQIIAVFEAVYKEKEYIYSSLSSDGKLLCTQGRGPNYFIIVWSVTKNRLLASKKCNMFQIYKTEITSFSRYKAKILTCGVGYLMFWELASSYGGHKLYSRQIRTIPKKLLHMQTFALVPHLKKEIAKLEEEEEETKPEEPKEEEEGEGDEEAPKQEGEGDEEKPAAADEEKEADEKEPVDDDDVDDDVDQQAMDDKDDDDDVDDDQSDEDVEPVVEDEEKPAEDKAEEQAEKKDDEKPKEELAKEEEEEEPVEEKKLDLPPILGDKVLTGTSEGNILVWHYSKMQCEITRRDDLPLHDNGCIVYIDYNPETNNVLTVGKDGYFRIWDYEVMYFESLSRRKEQDAKFEMQESYEGRILDENGTPIEIHYLIKKAPNIYYFQDPHGTIYTASLETSGQDEVAQKIYETHAGLVTGIAPSPFHYYIAVITDLGEFLIYNVLMKTLVIKKVFKVGCSSVLWLPFQIESTGLAIIVGFNDGTIRIIFAAVRYKEENITDQDCAVVIQAFKPHTDKITSICLNYSNNIIASSSHDKTVVIYETIPCKKHSVKLLAIHAIKTEGPISFFRWKETEDGMPFLICCTNGYFGEYILPDLKQDYRTTRPRYYLNVPKKISYFKNVKYEKKYLLPRKVRERVQKRLYYKRELLNIEDENITNYNYDPAFSEDSDFPALPPEEPVSLYFAKYLTDEIIWVSTDETHCGFFYEYKLGEDEPLNCIAICDAEDLPITCYMSLLDDQYMVLGLKNGRVRLVKLNPLNVRDLSDYCEIPAHDPFNGFITQLCVSQDSQIIYSSGVDGNVVAFKLNLSNVKYGTYIGTPKSVAPPDIVIDHDIPPNTPCIQKSRAEKVRSQEKAEKTEEIKKKIDKIRISCEDAKKLNDTLLPEDRFTQEFFILPSIKTELEKYKQNKIEEVMKKYNNKFYKVKTLLKNIKRYFSQDLQTHLVYLIGVRNKQTVTTYRTCKFDDYFLKVEEEVTEALEKENKIKRFFESKKESNQQKPKKKKKKKIDLLDNFLLENIKYIKQFGKEKRKYFEKLYYSRHRMLFLKDKLKELYELPQDDVVDFITRQVNEELDKGENLSSEKTCENTNPSRDRLMFALIKCLRFIYNLKEDFNKEVLKIRDFKLEIVYDYYLGKRDVLYIAKELKVPAGLEDIPEPPFDRFLEFPESYCEMHPAKFLPESVVPPIPQEWKIEHDYIYGDLDSTILISDDFLEDTPYLYKIGFNTTQITTRIKRLQRFRCRLSEIAAVESKLMVYDQMVEKIAYKKFTVDEQITQLTFIASSLYQELFIVRFYGIFEDNINEKKEEIIIRKAVCNLKLFVLEKKLACVNQAINDSLKKISAIESKAMDSLPPANTLQHERLKKMFFTRSTKICEEHGLSCSSFSEDSTDNSEVSCDERELDDRSFVDDYDIIYKLRVKRNIERAALHKSNKMKEYLIEVKNYFKERRTISEVIIAMYVFKLLEFKDEKEKQLSNLNIIFIMRPSEMQCFDPKTNELANNLMFTTIETVKQHAQSALDMENEVESTKQELRVVFNHIRKTLSNIKSVCKKREELRKAIKERMITRFGKEIDIKEFVDCTLKSMVLNQKAKNKTFISPYQEKVKKLQKKAQVVRGEFLEKVRENTCKMHIVCSVIEEKNKALEYSLKPHSKTLFKKEDLEREVAILQQSIELEEARKANLMEAIASLRYKGEHIPLDDDETLLKKIKKEKKYMDFSFISSSESAVQFEAVDIFDEELDQSELTSLDEKLEEELEEIAKSLGVQPEEMEEYKEMIELELGSYLEGEMSEEISVVEGEEDIIDEQLPPEFVAVEEEMGEDFEEEREEIRPEEEPREDVAEEDVVTGQEEEHPAEDEEMSLDEELPEEVVDKTVDEEEQPDTSPKSSVDEELPEEDDAGTIPDVERQNEEEAVDQEAED